MNYTYRDVAGMIDHSLLNPTLSEERLDQGILNRVVPRPLRVVRQRRGHRGAALADDLHLVGQFLARLLLPLKAREPLVELSLQVAQPDVGEIALGRVRATVLVGLAALLLVACTAAPLPVTTPAPSVSRRTVNVMRRFSPRNRLPVHA